LTVISSQAESGIAAETGESPTNAIIHAWNSVRNVLRDGTRPQLRPGRLSRHRVSLRGAAGKGSMQCGTDPGLWWERAPTLIFIDTSVFAVMLLGEPEAEPFALAIARYPGRLVCAFTRWGLW